MFTELKSEHIDGLYRLLQTLDKDDKRFFHPHPFTKKYLSSLPSKKYDYYFVLIIDKKIIGYSMLRTLCIYPQPTFGGVIHKEYRNMKYGDVLLSNTLKKAKNFCFDSVLLKVDKDNIGAMVLYKKKGFKETQENENEIWMKKKL